MAKVRGHVVFALAVIVAVLLAAHESAISHSPSASASPRQAPGPRITVMTWNLYAGGDFDSLLDGSLVNAMGEILESVRATNFPQRAARIAAEVQRHQPHLIGLQEVALWRTSSIITGSTSVEYDFLSILQAHLAARGLRYDVLASLTTLDFEAPGMVDGSLRDIRWTERIVVLKRRSAQLQVRDVRTRRYADFHTIDLGAMEIEFRRGWIQATVDFRGRRFRLVNTHLEAMSVGVQASQAAELVQRAGNTNLPLLMVGDFNSAAGGFSSATYGNLIASGFTDAWAQRHEVTAGPTCCQDGDLRNGASELDRRIDLALYRGAFTVAGAARIGHRQADRTPSGLWPSDHAGVVVRLRTP